MHFVGKDGSSMNDDEMVFVNSFWVRAVAIALDCSLFCFLSRKTASFVGVVVPCSTTTPAPHQHDEFAVCLLQRPSTAIVATTFLTDMGFAGRNKARGFAVGVYVYSCCACNDESRRRRAKGKDGPFCYCTMTAMILLERQHETKLRRQQ
jgi:hypothetical protein